MTPTRTPVRVLVLEDRADDAELMIWGLEDAGYHVSWTRVDLEADFIAALSPDLDVILADYTLPSFDVLHALGRLEESGLSVPFIVVSGTISEEVAVDCIKRGAADYLVKDRLARLPAAVGSALDGRRLRDEREAAVLALQCSAEELSAANAALRVADEMKDHLLAITAHELRTPLTSILGYATLLRREWNGDARELGEGWVAIVEQQSRRMLSHVEDLLTLTAVELGVVQLQCEPVQLALALARAAAVSVPAGVRISCAEDLTVFADHGRLEQILVNLFNNAAKYGGSAISAEAHRDPHSDDVELRILDEGPGVPAEFVPALFDKFAQAAARSEGASGFGLGLAIVASLAAAHGGAVWYEPNLPRGACFAVRLPGRGVAAPS